MSNSDLQWVQIRYKKGMQFETDTGNILPTFYLVSVANNVYTVNVPAYCLDSNNRIQNSIMWSLYPQFKSYDFASGQP